MKFKSQLLTGAAIFAVIGTIAPQIGCSSSDSKTAAVAAPSITSFVAAKATITAGTSTTLTAVFADGTAVISDVTGAITSGTAVTVTPAATTTYTLTVTNSAGDKKTATVTVTVVAAPTITSFTASTLSIYSGESSTLSFEFADGTGSIDNGVGAVTSATDVPVSPTATTTYTLTVTNEAGTAVTATVAIEVTAVVDIGYGTDISAAEGVTVVAPNASSWTTPATIQDSTKAIVANGDSTETGYGAWPFIEEDEVEYLFSPSATVARSSVRWYSDSATADDTNNEGGIGAPSSYKVQYLDTDGSTWVDVANPTANKQIGTAWIVDSAYATTPYYITYASFNSVGFDAVSTTGIRLLMEPRVQITESDNADEIYPRAVGIQRWAVYGTMGATTTKK